MVEELFSLHFDLIFIIGGAIGSIIKIILEEDGNFKLPSIYAQNINGVERRILSVGFIGNIVVGVIVAMWIDHSMLVSIMAAIAGPWVIEQAFKLMQNVKKGTLKVEE